MAKKKSFGRRGFLKGAAGAALAAQAPLAKPQEQRGSPADATGSATVSSNERAGSDFMVDVIKSLGIEYCAANPGTSFRGLHESVINYGNNKDPEFLTCLHEESSVAMA